MDIISEGSRPLELQSSNDRLTLRNWTYSAIKELILVGHFQPGRHLPLTEVAEELQTSVTPVREALAILEREGLVVYAPRRGFSVSRIEINDILDLFDFRMMLEANSIERAAKVIVSEECDQLQSLCSEYHPGDIESYRRHIAESKEFHLLIARIGGNQWLTNALETVLDHLHRVLYLGVSDPDTAFDLRHEHDDIVSSLRARNVEDAKAAILAHVEHVRKEYLASNKAITTILGQIMNR